MVENRFKEKVFFHCKLWNCLIKKFPASLTFNVADRVHRLSTSVHFLFFPYFTYSSFLFFLVLSLPLSFFLSFFLVLVFLHPVCLVSLLRAVLFYFKFTFLPVCIRMLPVCCSYVLVCDWYVTCRYSIVCLRISSVCIRMNSYVTRMCSGGVLVTIHN